MQFDKNDFQDYLNQPSTYWEDFGRRCAAGLLQFGMANLGSEQIEGVISSTLTRMTQDTGALLGPEQRDAFAKGMREGYNQKPENASSSQFKSSKRKKKKR